MELVANIQLSFLFVKERQDFPFSNYKRISALLIVWYSKEQLRTQRF
jgi:hypothetical protein